jgi:hypothetical protein
VASLQRKISRLIGSFRVERFWKGALNASNVKLVIRAKKKKKKNTSHCRAEKPDLDNITATS